MFNRNKEGQLAGIKIVGTAGGGVSNKSGMSLTGQDYFRSAGTAGGKSNGGGSSTRPDTNPIPL